MDAFFKLVGFGGTVLFLLALSGAGFLAFMNNCGRYNIGGVPNSVSTKFWTYVYLVAVGLGWYALFSTVHISIAI